MAPKRLFPLGNLPPASPSSESSDSDSDSESSESDERESAEKPTLSNPTLPKQDAVADVAHAQKKGKPLIWTVDAELAVLKAMDEFISKKGLDPYADSGAFFEFAKKSIPLEATKSQVMDKLRRLRKKYENNAQNGELVFSTANEAKAFGISKKIWGGAAVAESSAKSEKRKAKGVKDAVEKESNKKPKKEKPLDSVKDDDGKEIVVEKHVVVGESLKVDQVGFWDKYPRLKEALEVENNGTFLKEDGKRAIEFDLCKMGDTKAKELDDKWKSYQAKEAELKLFKLELVTEQTKIVLSELMEL